jgi:hypothetical protein
MLLMLKYLNMFLFIGFSVKFAHQGDERVCSLGLSLESVSWKSSAWSSSHDFVTSDHTGVLGPSLVGGGSLDGVPEVDPVASSLSLLEIVHSSSEIGLVGSSEVSYHVGEVDLLGSRSSWSSHGSGNSALGWSSCGGALRSEPSLVGGWSSKTSPHLDTLIEVTKSKSLVSCTKLSHVEAVSSSVGLVVVGKDSDCSSSLWRVSDASKDSNSIAWKGDLSCDGSWDSSSDWNSSNASSISSDHSSDWS